MQMENMYSRISKNAEGCEGVSHSSIILTMISTASRPPALRSCGARGRPAIQAPRCPRTVTRCRHSQGGCGRVAALPALVSSQFVCASFQLPSPSPLLQDTMRQQKPTSICSRQKQPPTFARASVSLPPPLPWPSRRPQKQTLCCVFRLPRCVPARTFSLCYGAEVPGGLIERCMYRTALHTHHAPSPCRRSRCTKCKRPW
jgi:hypothetical protein